MIHSFAELLLSRFHLARRVHVLGALLDSLEQAPIPVLSSNPTHDVIAPPVFPYRNKTVIRLRSETQNKS